MRYTLIRKCQKSQERGADFTKEREWLLTGFASVDTVDLKLFHNIKQKGVVISHLVPVLNGMKWRSGFCWGWGSQPSTDHMCTCGQSSLCDYVPDFLSVAFFGKRFFGQRSKVILRVSQLWTGKYALTWFIYSYITQTDAPGSEN